MALHEVLNEMFANDCFQGIVWLIDWLISATCAHAHRQLPSPGHRRRQIDSRVWFTSLDAVVELQGLSEHVICIFRNNFSPKLNMRNNQEIASLEVITSNHYVRRNKLYLKPFEGGKNIYIYSVPRDLIKQQTPESYNNKIHGPLVKHWEKK